MLHCFKDQASQSFNQLLHFEDMQGFTWLCIAGRIGVLNVLPYYFEMHVVLLGQQSHSFLTDEEAAPIFLELVGCIMLHFICPLLFQTFS